jgi:PAS domain S-box-containing protein
MTQNSFSKISRMDAKLVVFVLIALVPLVVAGCLALVYARRIVEGQVMGRLQIVADSKARQIEGYLLTKEVDVTVCSQNPTVLSHLESLGAAFHQKGLPDPEYVAAALKARSYFIRYTQPKSYDNVLLVDAGGDVIFSVFPTDLLGKNLRAAPCKSTALAREFENVVMLLATRTSDFETDEAAGEQKAYVTAPIFKNGALAGILMLRINNGELFGIAADYIGLGDTGESVIGRRENDSILVMAPTRHDPAAAFHRRIAFDSPAAIPMQEATRGHGGIGRALDYRGVTVLAAWKYLPTLRCGLVVKQDTAEAFAPIQTMSRGALALGILATLLIVFLTPSAARHLSAPIRELARATRAFSAGELTRRARITSSDEIGDLASAFNQMATTIQQQITALSRSRDELERLVEERTADLAQTNRSLQTEIAEHRRTEAVLRESEARYRALFEGSADGIVIADSETKRFKYANPALCRMLGYAEDELRSMGVMDVHPKNAVQAIIAEFEAQARGDKTLAADVPCLRKDGSVFHADVNATKVAIDGRPCNVGFFRDITERKRMDTALRASEKRLREINILQRLLLHPNPIEHKLKFITEAVVRIVGADFARVWMIAPGDRCAAGCIHAQVTEGPHVCRFRERCLHLLASSGRYTHTDGGHGRVPFGCYKIGKIAAGEELKFLTNEVTTDPRVHNHEWARELGLVSFAGYRLSDSNGPLGVLALFSKQPVSADEDLLLEGIANATSLVLRSARAEEAHRQSEERFRQFADLSSEVIWFTEFNPERILFVNRMVETVWGLPAERFYQDARVWTASIHPDDRPRVHEAWEACLQSRVPRFEAEYRVVRPDGSIRWVLDGGLPIRNADGEIVRLSGVARDMTERKRMETELTYERDLLRTLLDHSPDDIYFKDIQSRFIKASKAMARRFGTASPDAMAGRTDFDFFAEAHARPAFEDEQEIIRTGVPFIGKVEKEVWLDGRETWCLTTKMPFCDKDGTIIGTFGVSMDITALKKIENALAYERDLFQMLMDQSPDSIYFKDLQSRFVRFSRSKVKRSYAAELARHTAAHPDEQEANRPAHLAGEEQFAEYLAGRTDFDFFTEEHARPAFEDEQQIIRTGVPIIGKVEKEVWLDGRETWVLTSKMPFLNKDGQIVGTFGVSKDITELKHSEAALVETSALLETLLQNTTDPIYFKDLQSRFVHFSRSMLKLLNLPGPDAMKGRTDFDFFSEEHARPAFDAEQEIIRTGQPMLNLEEKETHIDGRITWALTSKMPWRDKDGNIIGTMGISKDITERKLMEDHLFQSQKLETVGRLAGGVAHEFNSILTTIIMQSELLLQELAPGGPFSTNVNEIRKAADRAATLTRQLLAYGRKQLLRPEDLDLNHIIARMDGVLRHLMGEKTSVNIVPAAGLHLVNADAGQIEQVIINMALNARDAMPDGGRLTLETANVPFDMENAGRCHESNQGSHVMLAITDTGRGMSAEVKAHVFDPFYTTKGVGQGTGLGLTTCYGIIKQSGGQISVDSEPGRGTTFKIFLPQSRSQTQIPVQRPAPPELPCGTETILLVEKDPALCEMEAALLQRLGYTVLTAANVIDALNLKQKPGTRRIDLLFTDVLMPHMNGKELADRMLALHPGIRTLFTSDYIENTIVPQGVAFLHKPFTPSALAHKLREVLDQPAPQQTQN